MPSKRQYDLVQNEDSDPRVPVHPDEAFHHGISFNAKVRDIDALSETCSCIQLLQRLPLGVNEIFNAAAFSKTRSCERAVLIEKRVTWFFFHTFPSPLEVVEEVAFNEMEGLLFLSFVSFIRLTEGEFGIGRLTSCTCNPMEYLSNSSGSSVTIRMFNSRLIKTVLFLIIHLRVVGISNAIAFCVRWK